MMIEKNALVQPEWLYNHLNDPDLVVLDGSMKKTVSGPNKTYN